MEKLARNTGELVSKLDGENQYKIETEARIKALEIWVKILVAIDAAIGLAVLGLLFDAIKSKA